MQYAKLPCPSLAPGVCSNSCPLSGWCCCPTFSFSITPFCPQSFSASGSFPMSQLYTSVGQSIGALASVLPMNIQGWFPLGLTGLIFLQSKGLWRVFSSTTIEKHLFFGPGPQPSLWSNFHIHTRLLEKPWLLTIHTFVSKVMSLLYNKLSRFVIAFLIRSKHLLNLWLQSPSIVILEPKKKNLSLFPVFSFCLPWNDGTRCRILVFWMLRFNPAFHSHQEAL